MNPHWLLKGSAEPSLVVTGVWSTCGAGSLTHVEVCAAKISLVKEGECVWADGRHSNEDVLCGVSSDDRAEEERPK